VGSRERRRGKRVARCNVFSPSPRKRGEGRDEGALSTVRTCGEAPDPDPLPASGEREKNVAADRLRQLFRLAQKRRIVGDHHVEAMAARVARHPRLAGRGAGAGAGLRIAAVGGALTFTGHARDRRWISGEGTDRGKAWAVSRIGHGR
jgi:hypothetical protein